MTSFSAGPQALGYLYQARVALLLLLQAPDESRLKVEAMDDIELHDALAENSLALVQLKHHTTAATPPTHQEDPRCSTTARCPRAPPMRSTATARPQRKSREDRIERNRISRVCRFVLRTQRAG